MNHSENKEFTVNSSPYAVPVYHKFGFVDTDCEQLTDGMRYTPMKFRR
ncbi:GNAT family N-acetyltransferase [Blautia coccoides]|nr:GNAT family N-acetyltransferase [Blautia coccoides]MCQ4640814.1 GNAT family N-acetyltransferase [Blautia coccoides]